jgi:hypothetical protein
MPWWLDNKKLDFPRGYHIECGAGLSAQLRLHGRDPELSEGGGYGKALKDQYRKYYGATIGFSGGARWSQRRLVLRDRPQGGRPVGDSGPSLHWKWTITSTSR